MKRNLYITIALFFLASTAFSQVLDNEEKRMQIKGSVKTKETSVPLSGVTVSTDRGDYTVVKRAAGLDEDGVGRLRLGVTTTFHF